MLPVTHGEAYTRLHVLLYTLLLFAVSMLPVGTGMGGRIYLAGAALLGARFIQYGWRLHRQYSDALARRTFRYSIWYLSGLFAIMLVDHYISIPI
jgi:protoheme IX farnesyltransferase